VEELVAQQLGTVIRPGGGFTFKLPSPTRRDSSGELYSTGEDVPVGENIHGAHQSSEGGKNKAYNDHAVSPEVEDKNPEPSQSLKCDSISMKKVCCLACREKVKLACAKVQERDKHVSTKK